MAIVGSLALILFYILTRTVDIPSIGIQDDVGVTDVLTKVMQAAIVVLSVYILVITKKEEVADISTEIRI